MSPGGDGEQTQVVATWELIAEARIMGISFGAYRAAPKAEGVIARKEQTLNGG